MRILRTFAIKGSQSLGLITERVADDDKRDPAEICVSAIDAFRERLGKDILHRHGRDVIVRTSVVDMDDSRQETALAAAEHTRKNGTRAIDPGQFLDPALAA